MKIIEETKQRNLDTHALTLSMYKAGSKHHRDILNVLPQIQKHNDSIHEEWSTLIDNDHAFDEDLYNLVQEEHTFKDG